MFPTSPNGAISRIPAGYHVEVRDLLVGTRFRVEERPGDIPAGYTFVEYVRDGASYITTGDVNAGMIRDNESPAIEVHNRRGIGITAEKVWSDADFMDSHGNIHLAVYVKEKQSGDMELLQDSVKELQHPSRKVTWFWDRLQDGASLSDYVVREVKVDGSSVVPVEEGGAITVKAKSKESSNPGDYTYTATYTPGQITGSTGNVRNDIVINSRHGIRIEKRSWDGSRPLPGAVFRLTDPNGNTVGESSYTSGEDGQVKEVYLNVDTEYTLTEIQAPAGFQTLEKPLKFVLKADGRVEVTDGSEGSWSLPQTRGIQATLTVKDRPFRLQAVKQGVQGEKDSDPKLLGGVHFKLQQEVTVDGVTDWVQMADYQDLVSEEETGIIRGIDETLPAGTYRLFEKEAPTGCKGLEDTAEGTRVYTLRITNRLTAVPVVIVKIDQQGAKKVNAEFTLFREDTKETTVHTSQILEKGGDAVLFQTDAMNLGKYVLTETRAPAGCLLLEKPIPFEIKQKPTGIVIEEPEDETIKKYVDIKMIDTNHREKGWKITVINVHGYEMPSTGGRGTLLFSLSGIVLILMGSALKAAGGKKQ